MQGIFQKENTDKALKYGIYRHLPTYEKIIRNLVSFYNKKLIKLWEIELLMLFCGLFWEYLTPLFRKNTVSDIFDVLAYMVGGLIYWMFARKERNEN